VLELGEGARVAGAGPSERQIVAGTAALPVGVWRGLGFGGGGAVALAVHVDGLLEASDVFGGEDGGFGVDAGLEAVHGGDGLACDRGAADRFWGVTAVSFDLAEGRHGWLASALRSDGQADPEGTACPAFMIERRFWGFGGERL
jgi:hypothetical protein